MCELPYDECPKNDLNECEKINTKFMKYSHRHQTAT